MSTKGYFVQAALGGGRHAQMKQHFDSREEAEAWALKMNLETGDLFDVVEMDQFDQQTLVGSAYEGRVRRRR